VGYHLLIELMMELSVAVAAAVAIVVVVILVYLLQSVSGDAVDIVSDSNIDGHSLHPKYNMSSSWVHSVSRRQNTY
jgi:hypothetical protein